MIDYSKFQQCECGEWIYGKESCAHCFLRKENVRFREALQKIARPSSDEELSMLAMHYGGMTADGFHAERAKRIAKEALEGK